jgi:hypothetical protein
MPKPAVLTMIHGRPMENWHTHEKTRWDAAGFFMVQHRVLQVQAELLQLDFLVFHMFACLGIKLHDQHLVRCGLLVFGGRVEVTRAGSRFQLDFFACAFCHDDSP